MERLKSGRTIGVVVLEYESEWVQLGDLTH